MLNVYSETQLSDIESEINTNSMQQRLNSISGSGLQQQQQQQQPNKSFNKNGIQRSSSISTTTKPSIRPRCTSESGIISNLDNISYRADSGGGGAGGNGIKRSRSIKSHRSSSITTDASTRTGSSVSSVSSCSDDGETCTSSGTSSSGEPNLPYPGFIEYSLNYLSQDTKPRNWCLHLITNPYPFSI